MTTRTLVNLDKNSTWTIGFYSSLEHWQQARGCWPRLKNVFDVTQWIIRSYSMEIILSILLPLLLNYQKLTPMTPFTDLFKLSSNWVTSYYYLLRLDWRTRQRRKHSDEMSKVLWRILTKFYFSRFLSTSDTPKRRARKIYIIITEKCRGQFSSFFCSLLVMYPCFIETNLASTIIRKTRNWNRIPKTFPIIHDEFLFRCGIRVHYIKNSVRAHAIKNAIAHITFLFGFVQK